MISIVTNTGIHKPEDFFTVMLYVHIVPFSALTLIETLELFFNFSLPNTSTLACKGSDGIISKSNDFVFLLILKLY